MRVAALDLGTNTFLCLIVEGQKHCINKILYDGYETVRLGQGMAQHKTIHPDALKRADDCLKNYSEEIRKHRVDKVLGIATSAARDASNGKDLLAIGERYSLPIHIISGKQESEMTFAGALNGFSVGTKPVGVLDIGGGSTEIGFGAGDQLKNSLSLDIGGVRLTERFISQQPVSPSDERELLKFIDQQFETLEITKISEMFAVAGTPTSLAALEIGGFEASKINGHFLSLEKIIYWQQIFAKTTIEEKKLKYQLAGRADIIYVGTSILRKAVEKFNLRGVTVSAKGIRYGLAMQMLEGKL